MTKLFMFPGQGSQHLEMGKDWCREFKEASLAFEEASDAVGLDLKKICFDSDDETLKKTEITQPAILTATVAIFRSVEKARGFDKKNYLFAGHSLGEYSALTCMGAISLAEATKLVHHRGKYMQEAVAPGLGAMAAMVFKPKTDGAALAARLCEKVNAEGVATAAKTRALVSVANYNSPEQIVVSGHKEAVARLQELAEGDASLNVRKVIELPVSAPFHCALMKPAADRLKIELDAAGWLKTDYHYIANIDAALHAANDSKAIVERLYAQITGSVRWVESVQSALKAEITQAVEIGPGKVLQGLAKRISFAERSLESIGIDSVEEFKTHESSLT